MHKGLHFFVFLFFHMCVFVLFIFFCCPSCSFYLSVSFLSLGFFIFWSEYVNICIWVSCFEAMSGYCFTYIYMNIINYLLNFCICFFLFLHTFVFDDNCYHYTVICWATATLALMIKIVSLK